MHKLPLLKKGDSVEIIAPASRCAEGELETLVDLLESWHLKCLVNQNIFGEDLFCANTDALRFQHLKDALFNQDTKAIISVRGGYGSMRLIPALMALAKPPKPKLFVGMSDTTALSLFFQKKWNWPSIHGSLAANRFSAASIQAMQGLFFEKKDPDFNALTAVNREAFEEKVIEGRLTGGNLSLVQASIGTSWQLNAERKILLLEEVGERGYRIDRMLQHLDQASMFKDVKALVFGDFSRGLEPDGSSLIEETLQRFAASCAFPVVRIKGIGHDYINFPIPLGTQARLKLGQEIQLVCSRS